MTTFTFETTAGKKYTVDAADQATAIRIWKTVNQSYPTGNLPSDAPAGPLQVASGAATPTPTQQDQPPITHRGQLLPVDTDQSGGLHFDLGSGVTGAIADALSLPHDVYTGQQNVDDPSTIGRAANFAMMAGPIGDVGGGGLIGTTRAATGAETVPTTGDLYAAADAGYKQARNLGVVYNSQSVAKAIGAAQTAMEGDGLIAENAPQTFAVLAKLQSPPAGSTAPFTGLEAARQALNHIRQDNAGKTDGLAAGRAINALDDFFANPDPSSVVAGPASQVASVAKSARANYAAASRSADLEGKSDYANLRADAANSGLNTDNAIRQRVAVLFDPQHPERLRGYTPDQVAALKQVVQGTATRNTLRWVGNFLGGGGGLGAGLVGAGGAAMGFGLGGMEGGTVGAATGPVLGASAKLMANHLTGKALDNVAQSVRAGSPLAADLLSNPPRLPTSPASTNLAARAFVGNQLNDIDARRQQAIADALQNQQIY